MGSRLLGTYFRERRFMGQIVCTRPKQPFQWSQKESDVKRA